MIKKFIVGSLLIISAQATAWPTSNDVFSQRFIQGAKDALSVNYTSNFYYYKGVVDSANEMGQTFLKCNIPDGETYSTMHTRVAKTLESNFTDYKNESQIGIAFSVFKKLYNCKDY